MHDWSPPVLLIGVSNILNVPCWFKKTCVIICKECDVREDHRHGCGTQELLCSHCISSEFMNLHFNQRFCFWKCCPDGDTAMLLKLRDRSKREGSVYIGSLGSSKVLVLDTIVIFWSPGALVGMLEEKLSRF